MITVSKKVTMQFLKVRETGRVNMMDVNGVQRVAHDLDLHALVLFIEERDHGDVAKMVMGAFEVEDEDGIVYSLEEARRAFDDLDL